MDDKYAKIKQAQLKKKEQQWKMHEPSDYSNKHRVPFPDFIEFGKVFDIPLSSVLDEQLVHISYQTLLQDFFRTKAENFPTWEGLPTIKVQEGIKYKLAWHVAVPKTFVIDKDQKREDELWNS